MRTRLLTALIIAQALAMTGVLLAADTDALVADADRYGRYDANLFLLTAATSSTTVNAMGEAFQAKKERIVADLAERIAADADPSAAQEALSGHLASVEGQCWADELAQDLVAALEPRGVDCSGLQLRASRSYREDAFQAELDRARLAVAQGPLVANLYFEEGDPLAVADELTTKASNFQGQSLRFLGKGEFAFTFDDGPHTGGRTARVLDALRDNGVHATFFQLGSSIAAEGAGAALQKRIAAEGHDVGVHGWYHATKDGKPFPTISSDAIRTDLTRAHRTIERAYGRAPVTFRAPYGEFRTSDFDILGDLGLTYVGWDIDTNDWQKKTPDELAAETISLMDRAGKGIVLMHDVQERSSLAIAKILAHVKSRGYRTPTIREKLGGGSPSPSPAPGPGVEGRSSGVVTASALNVRSAPSAGSSALGKLAQGDRVTILATTGDFYRISFAGGEGYVAAQYVQVQG